MTLQTILIEDDPNLATAICQGLHDDGIDCQWHPSAESGWQVIAQATVDVVILDLMLPGMSGLEFLEKLRANRIQTPVLILTALGSLDDRVSGLNAGADDYLVKPFEMPELSARILRLLGEIEESKGRS